MYFEWVTYHAPAARLVTRHGRRGHVLYGSDAPPLTSLKPRAIRLTEDLDLGPGERRQSSGCNAARLLKLSESDVRQHA
jgi:predicted TIM-barrel fold metal-dependent hydrolase